MTSFNLTDALKGSRRSGTSSVVPGFLRPIDTEQIARNLNIDSKAAAHGSNELPTTSSKQLDATEQEITQTIVGEWSWQGDEYLNQLRAYASRLAQYAIHSEHQRLRLVAENAIAQLRGANTRAPAELGPLKQAYIEARDEFEAFRSEQRLSRPARDPAHRWTTLGLMFVLVAVESVLNGVFFAKGSDGGLVGGIGTAIGVSIANVAFSFLLGLGPARWMNSRGVLLRAIGVLLTLIGATSLLVLHTFVAQFRDATVRLGEERAFSAAIEMLVSAPWKVSDVYSIYLFGLGVLFSIAAWYKGHTFDDPYPGYGSAFRRRVAAQENYSDQHALVFDELEDIKDHTIDQLKTGIAQMPLFPQHADNIRSEQSALIERFRAYEAAIGAAANQLLARYRTMNRKSRQTPVPDYFDEAWKLPRSFLETTEPGLTEDPGAAPPIEPLLRELSGLSQALLAEYEKLIVSFPHPTNME